MVTVLLSGGVDSLLLAEMAYADGVLAGCVFVDYGHPARQAESWRAFAWAERHGVRLHVAHCMGLNLGAMDGGPGSSAQVVPARNAIFLAIAANIAASWGSSEVWIGANASDASDYPDCRGPFLDAMAGALGVTVCAPLLDVAKAQIVADAKAAGISDAWACYGPGPEPCGECSSCRSTAGAQP